MTFPRTALPATVTAVALLASACGSGGTDTPAADSTGTDSPATETTAPAAADFDAALCDPLTTFVDGSVNIADPERVDAVRTLADAFPDAPFADYAEVWEPLADAGELTIELFVDYTADVEPLLTQPILPDAADAAASACDLDEHATSLLVNGPTQTPEDGHLLAEGVAEPLGEDLTGDITDANATTCNTSAETVLGLEGDTEIDFTAYPFGYAILCFARPDQIQYAWGVLAGRPPAANVLFGDLLDTPGELVTDHQPAAEALDVPTANGHAGYDQQADQWVLTYAFPLDGRDLDFGDDYEVLPADEYVGVLSAAYDV